MEKKRRGCLGRAAACLLVIFAVCILADGRVGWFPVMGNLVSAARMRTYAAQAWPGLMPEGLWAEYDLKNGCYYLPFALKGGVGERNLYYDLKTGLVKDERRAMVLRKELGIAKNPEVNGHRVYWGVRWDPWEPEEPVVDIRIYFGDTSSAPIPDEEAMRERMAQEAMALYQDLSPRTPVHTVSVHYSHAAQSDERGGCLWHSVTVDLPEDTPLTEEMILSGTLVSR